MIFEIVNPSDACTLEAENFEVAAVACLIIGDGMYGLRQVGGDKEMPILAFGPGSADKWFVEHFGRPVEASLDALKMAPELVTCLDSVLLGTPRHREVYAAAMEAIADQAGRDKFKATWHDKHRSSVNDICRAGWSMADALRAIQQPASSA